MRIGLFDSGLGGLTIAKGIIDAFYDDDVIYLADKAYAPYGQKDEAFIQERSIAITKYLLNRHNIDLLVVACNSATTSAIELLRKEFTTLPIVGTEPGIKPAINATKSKKVLVMATEATLSSKKYRALQERLLFRSDVEVINQPCPGLVEAIEEGREKGRIKELLKGWLEPSLEKGVDTVVLGCTHYPLVKNEIREVAQKEIVIIETTEAIVSRVAELKRQLCAYSNATVSSKEPIVLTTAPLDKRFISKILKSKSVTIDIEIE